MPFLLLLPLILGGCSVGSININLSPSAAKKATPVSTTVVDPTAQAAPTPAFAMQAGNCPEAANQAITLMGYTQSKGANLDPRLELAPLDRRCGADGADLTTYRARVTSATLNMYVIDGSWSSLYLASRSALLRDLMGRLHRLYPAAICKVLIYQGDTVLGSITLGTDNNPQVSCCTG